MVCFGLQAAMLFYLYSILQFQQKTTNSEQTKPNH